MTIYDVLCQWNKETEIVIKHRKWSGHVVNCHDVCRKLSWHFFSRPLAAVPFWILPIRRGSGSNSCLWKPCRLANPLPATGVSQAPPARSILGIVQKVFSPKGFLTHFWRNFDAFLTHFGRSSFPNKTRPILTHFWCIFDAFLTHFWRILAIADAFSENTFWTIPHGSVPGN